MLGVAPLLTVKVQFAPCVPKTLNLRVSPSELNSLFKKEYDRTCIGACVGKATAEAFIDIKSPDTLIDGKVYCAKKIYQLDYC